jgi:hypothetical protein
MATGNGPCRWGILKRSNQAMPRARAPLYLKYGPRLIGRTARRAYGRYRTYPTTKSRRKTRRSPLARATPQATLPRPRPSPNVVVLPYRSAYRPLALRHVPRFDASNAGTNVSRRKHLKVPCLEQSPCFLVKQKFNLLLRRFRYSLKRRGREISLSNYFYPDGRRAQMHCGLIVCRASLVRRCLIPRPALQWRHARIPN